MAEAAGLQFTPLDEIAKINEELRTVFLSGKTRDVEYRKNQLKQLSFMIKDNTEKFVESIRMDLGRSRFESMFAEIMGTINECVEAVHNVDKWAKDEKVWAGMAWALHKPIIKKEPKGTVLVLGAWNYPITVQIGPVIAAIAAGNTVVLKPSEVSAHTAKLIAELWPKYMDQEAYRIVNGAIPESTALLDLRWEHIFYTGNGTVGRIVSEKAAKWLCPTTLELGGKSPTIVDETADLKIAAHRILWGKSLNCGQTCIAPDYVLCTASVQGKFVEEIKKAAAEFWPSTGGGATQSDSYGRIINEGHWKRLSQMVGGTKGTIILGGESDVSQKLLTPTVIADCKPDDPTMTGEIFGPVLPIVPVKNTKEAIAFINSRDQPLALYIFAADHVANEIMDNTRSGSVVVGDNLLQYAIGALPFGGTGPSGYGSYHGKAGFMTFSHERATLIAPHIGIMGKIVEMALKPRYPPYTDANLKQFAMLIEKNLNYSRPSNPHASKSKVSV
jgi:aldehyde dehydrogenase (NAD+)